MSKGKAQWRERNKHIDVELGHLRRIDEMYLEKDTLRKELTESQHSLRELRVRYTVNFNVMHQALSELASQLTELRRSHSSSPNKMGDHEREEMVRMMTDTVTAHGKLEAAFEAQKAEMQKLKAEMQKLKTEAGRNKNEVGALGVDMGSWKVIWRKLYKFLSLNLHPDKTGAVEGDDPRTQGFKAAASVNDFFNSVK